MLRTLFRLLGLSLLAPLLAGCLHTGIGSVKGGECKIFERPAYVVLGQRSYDQDWIDSQIEGGVGACKWKRPAPRPASIDATSARHVSVPVKKRGLIARAKARVKTFWPKPSPVPMAPLPVVVPQPPPKRSAVDELLNPGGR